MTTKEQFPLFFAKPERYLGINVECIETHEDGDFIFADQGDTFKMDVERLNDLIETDTMYLYAPKFKPQEGKAFIKDLEEAVLSGLQDKAELWEDTIISKIGGNPTWYVVKLKTEEFWVEVKVSVGNISQVVVSGMLLDANYNDNLGAYCFNAVAYTDTLRDKHYYV